MVRTADPTTWIKRICVAVVGALALCVLAGPVHSAKVLLKDGRILSGRVNTVAGVAEDPIAPGAEPSGVRPILVIHDGLRRTFIPKDQVVPPVDPVSTEPKEKIQIPQPVTLSSNRLGSIGQILRADQFDQYGRRIFTMRGPTGPMQLVQGITEITPLYTTVQCLAQEGVAVNWEMRLATSSIPPDVLEKIFEQTIDQTNPDHRLGVVRLYLEAERYEDARDELEAILKDFPNLREELDSESKALRQMGSRRILAEIEMRRDAGQYALVQSLLSNFPTEDVAGETLQHVREILASSESQRKEGEQIVTRLDELASQLKDSSLRERVEKVLAEIKAELNFMTLPRMAAFSRLAGDAALKPEQKLSLAISGWLQGSDGAGENLPVSLSLYDVRGLVRTYLREPLAAEREHLLTQMRSMEGATPQQVDLLVEHMRPPLDLPQPVVPESGLYVLSVPGLGGEPDVRYSIQLPPEYDPYRRYPTVVTLNGGGSTPEMQLDWWAGGKNDKGVRMGQATRKGYIVIAVDWQQPHQIRYEYSAREHYAVLASLRDARRRFSIDTDRVFLSGHDYGGDAVWDIGLAHPDIWAGVIPIVAVADRYCTQYWQNAQRLPFYVVAGELDGDKTAHNSLNLDRYLTRRFDATLVEYVGRGHEHFSDEIQRIFDWMDKRRRDFFPTEIAVDTMRPWDNFFWWVELSDLPARSMVDPAAWPPPRNTRPLTVTASINQLNGIRVRCGEAKVTLWLSPELVDFEQRISITVNTRRLGGSEDFAQPDLRVLLEDVRTRGERQHLFWAKVQSP